MRREKKMRGILKSARALRKEERARQNSEGGEVSMVS